MAKHTVRALAALLLLAPLWLYAVPRVITLSPANTELAFAAGIIKTIAINYSKFRFIGFNVCEPEVMSNHITGLIIFL